ncbi:hypothetical protein V2W45_1337021 [Cenococcum geophilum]
MSKALPQERPAIPVVDEPLVPVAEETNSVTEPLLQPGPPFGIDGSTVSENGPALMESQAGKSVVSIFRSTREFIYNSVQCTRTQFPVAAAYAITIHKSQGLTLDRAVLGISERDLSPGLSYVAVSRAKKLSGIMFEETFDFELFQPGGRPSPIAMARERDAERRQSQYI